APGALEAMRSIAGPTWRNEVAARVFLEIGTYRPGSHAGALRCPLLVQVADDDLTAPVGAALKAAGKGRAEVRHYPGDHFDVYPGGPVHERVVEHQLAFLLRHLGH
ncbi:MAG: putative alpha/beta hydrolase, partial [Solirubrobacterales bacterium]|nr:putative alpha/beta hydrolase [Solirubrobacterales bacterium]